MHSNACTARFAAAQAAYLWGCIQHTQLASTCCAARHQSTCKSNTPARGFSAQCDVCTVYRDSFQNVVELLDDMFQRAAAADEPHHLNFVKKHAASLSSENPAVDNPAARLFSNPAGDYGSMVNERVGASDWTSAAELGDTWASRNAYSYGRGGERGVARGDVLQARCCCSVSRICSWLCACVP